MRQFAYNITIVLCVFCIGLTATQSFAAPGQTPHFPDILGYKTLACDFHVHTVFSDGDVWPTVRVNEAWRNGLDVMVLTDHIEYQPHKEDIPVNHNRSHDIAASLAQEMNILLPRGSEITRDTPPGHFNAIFLKDSVALDTPDLMDAMKAASEQEAFIFWNHPDWKPKHKGWFDVHTTLFENQYLHGIEVANGPDYSENAHQWCLEKNLTMLGNSDIHAPESDLPFTSDQHRTMTLVFAKDKTLPALKEALFAGRTVVWCKNQLIGRKPYLEALLGACIKVEKPHLRRDNQEKNECTVWFEVVNSSPVRFQLERTSATGPAKVTLWPHAVTQVKVTAPIDTVSAELAYTVNNALVEPGRGLPVKTVIDLK